MGAATASSSPDATSVFGLVGSALSLQLSSQPTKAPWTPLMAPVSHRATCNGSPHSFPLSFPFPFPSCPLAHHSYLNLNGVTSGLGPLAACTNATDPMPYFLQLHFAAQHAAPPPSFLTVSVHLRNSSHIVSPSSLIKTSAHQVIPLPRLLAMTAPRKQVSPCQMPSGTRWGYLSRTCL